MRRRSRNRDTAARGESRVAKESRNSVTHWPLAGRFWDKSWVGAFLLLAAVFVAYQKAWQAGFIWDDDKMLTENPCIIGPLGFKEIWTTTAGARIFPLTITSFWLQHLVWGLHPLPYHLFNVAMHGACAILLWRVLCHLYFPGAWFGAALWALHPVQVESVMWVTELKNTQSCFFYLLAILAFVRYQAASADKSLASGGRDYAFALFFAALAMASKSSTVVLPLVLGLVLWWSERRWRRRYLFLLSPFFLMSVITSGWSMWSQKVEGGRALQFALTPPERLVIAGRCVWFYLGKLAWPHPLMFIYPRWEIEVSNPVSYVPALALAVTMLFLWLRRASKLRIAFLALAYFVVALLPVIALVDHYFLRYSFVGDHFQYLASIAPLALFGAGASVATGFWKGGRVILSRLLAVSLLLLLAFTTWKQSEIYQDDAILWEDTIRQNPRAWIAYTNLGDLLQHRKEFKESQVLFEKAVQLAPNLALTHFNLGGALFRNGQVDQAISHYQSALGLTPIPSLRTLLYLNLGNALVQTGEVDQAVSSYEKSLAIEPSAQANTNLGYALFVKGQLPAAIERYETALRIKPDSPEAYYNLGVALEKLGRYQASVSHYEKALQIRPGYREAANNLAWILATCPEASVRDGARAVAIAQGANESSRGEDTGVLDTLAAAYAEAGRFPEATRTAESALQKAKIEANETLAADLQQKIALYLTNTAFHESGAGR